jgi:glucose-6-phosphate dehydrogenase assembly protein OpcA
MPTTYKVLGQLNPSATTLTTLYTVPSSTSTVVSTIVVGNLGAAAATYRIAVRPAGESIVNKHYVVYDATVAATDSVSITIGMTLAATDVISVYGSTSTMSFQAYGSEIS